MRRYRTNSQSPAERAADPRTTPAELDALSAQHPVEVVGNPNVSMETVLRVANRANVSTHRVHSMIEAAATNPVLEMEVVSNPTAQKALKRIIAIAGIMKLNHDGLGSWEVGKSPRMVQDVVRQVLREGYLPVNSIDACISKLRQRCIAEAVHGSTRFGDLDPMMQTVVMCRSFVFVDAIARAAGQGRNCTGLLALCKRIGGFSIDGVP